MQTTDYKQLFRSKPNVRLIEWDSEQEWLSMRDKPVIHASEASVLFGVNDFCKLPELFMRKKGLQLPASDPESAEDGHDAEEFIIKKFARRYRGELEVIALPKYCTIVNDEYPMLACTPDAMYMAKDGTWGPVEAKNVRFTKADQWEGEPPVAYQIQSLVQAMCCGAPNRVILRMTDLKLRDVFFAGRKLEHETMLLSETAKFLEDLKDDRMPPVDGSESTTRALNSFYKARNESVIDLPLDFADIAHEWECAKEEKKAIEERCEELANTIKAALGENTIGRYPGGSFSWKEQSRAEHMVKAWTFRVLRNKKAK